MTAVAERRPRTDFEQGLVQYLWNTRRDERRSPRSGQRIHELDDEETAALLDFFERAAVDARHRKFQEGKAADAKIGATATGLKPDIATMKAHIHALCDPAFVNPYPNAVLELAYGNPADGGDLNQAQTYSALNDNDLKIAAEVAARRNTFGSNIYIGAALRQYGNRSIPPDRRATVENYLASRFAWIDFDKAGDAERIEAVLKQHGLTPYLIVMTGTIPHQRGQLYFLISGIRDAEHLKQVNSALQRLLGSDPAVVAAQQPLRLAGSISHPTNKKAARGYVAELTALRKNEKAPIYTADHLISLAGSAGETQSGSNQYRQHDRRSAKFTADYGGYGDKARFEADPALIASALDHVPNNDLDWNEWKRVLMAAWRASNGDEAVFAAIDKWSSKSSKHDARETRKQWNKIFKSPPTNVGAGTILKMALDNGWSWPDAGQRPEASEQENADSEAVAALTSSAAAQELTEACEMLAASKAGQGSEMLHKLAFAIGQLIGAGRLQEQQVILRLTKAGQAVGEGDIAATIASGIAAGKLKPRLPTIKMIPGQIAQAIDYAETELLASGFPVLKRAGVLVQPVKSELAAADETRTEVVALRALRKEPMIYLLNKHAAVFKRYNERKKQFATIDPPPEVALGLLQKDQWEIPEVSGVTTTPTMRPDGTIFDQRGYDPATQLLYVPDRHLAIPPIKASPTRIDAMQALQRLDALLDGFPFVADVDRAVALAGLMTPVLRGAFNVAPMILLKAPTAGTGKSHYVNTASTIATGRACPVITNVASSEEMEKRLGAMVLEGVPIINLDNCSDDLGGDLLCQITEQRYVRIRILGKSETPPCEYRGSVYATGNNITYVGDMTRRGLICNLDAVLERPETRTFYFDPVKRAAAQRGQYIHDILAISRAYRVAGCPKPATCSPIGSYEAWSVAVREPLAWLGFADPIASMDTLREEDPARIAARRLMALHDELPSSFTVAELIQLADKMEAVTGFHPNYENTHPELRELLIQQASNFKGAIDSRKVGKWLGSIRGQIHDGFRLVLVKESKGHGNRYGIERAKRSDDQDDAPF